MKEFWNQTAEKFGKKEDYRPVLTPSSKGLLNWYADYLQKRALNRILKKLSGKFVLDIGCGVGRWSARLAEFNAQVVGVDLSREMAKRANLRTKRKNLSAAFIVASANMLPFKPMIFDSVISVTVLQHIVEETPFKSAVADMARIIKTDGEIILLEYAYHYNCSFSPHFPTIAHDYEKAFEAYKGLAITETRGVDLSLLVKPFNAITKNKGRYHDILIGKLSLKYRIASLSYYCLASLACVLSLPFDLVFSDTFKGHSEHRIFVFSNHAGSV